MFVLVHALGYKNCRSRGGVEVGQKWQNYVHVVVECPLAVHFQVTMYVKCYLSLTK